jgi:hypothetical protein
MMFTSVGDIPSKMSPNNQFYGGPSASFKKSEKKKMNDSLDSDNERAVILEVEQENHTDHQEESICDHQII